MMMVWLAALANTSCSMQQTYSSGQEFQRNVCNQIADFQERQRCLERLRDDYDTYQRRSEEIKSPR
jgi:hypothetical protein